MVIRFSVPCHEWNELAKSKEWKDFQTLLEKCQKKKEGGKGMLKKIYQELVAIRKELQDIKNILKPHSVDVFIGKEKFSYQPQNVSNNQCRVGCKQQ